MDAVDAVEDDPRTGRAAGAIPGELEHSAWPPWAGYVDSGFGLLLAALAIFDSHGDVLPHPGAVALVVVAALPWVVQHLGWIPPPLPFGLWVGVPLVTLNLAGEALGVIEFAGHGPHLSTMLLIYATGRTLAHLHPTRGWPVAALALAVPIGHLWIDPGFPGFGAWMAGTMLGVASGAALRAALVAVHQLRSAQALLAREAAQEERRRIAREVHDVIAHTLTVTMMHVTAARMALHRSPEEAAEALVEAERLGRQSLADVRRAVGLLRREDERATDAALPDARDVGDLVDRYRAGGLAVSLEVRGDCASLPPAVGLAVYRVVQEALANVVKHAPGASASVEIAVARDQLTIRVANGGRHAPRTAPVGYGGAGILGMRERAASLSGTLRAGPDGDGWVVECAIPLRTVAPGLGAGA